MDSIYTLWLQRIESELASGEFSRHGAPVTYWCDNGAVRKRIVELSGQHGYSANYVTRDGAPDYTSHGVEVYR